MSRSAFRFAALVTVLAMLLGGCMSMDLSGYPEELLWAMGYGSTGYDDMDYTRPDMQALEAVLDKSCGLAETAKSVEAVIEGVYDFYDAYDSFTTNYLLAELRYCSDLTDIYWGQEYDYCAENAATVDAMLEELYYALAESPHVEALESEEYFGADFFDAYQGDMLYDDAFVALLEQEAELISKYYELQSQMGDTEYYSEEFFQTYTQPLTQLLIQLVKLRRQIADAAGYDSYVDMAYEVYYYRDFTAAEAELYMEQVSKTLLDLYRQVNGSDVWYRFDSYCSEVETMQYLESVAQDMGGSVLKAYRCLSDGKLYDIEYSPNKMDGAYEVFLPSYYVPFIFMSPYLDDTDKLTLSHEFGHFANDYTVGGAYAGIDVAEVHSQAMEYLSLCYGSEAGKLAEYKMADSLSVYMEQSAYALFEQRLYALTEAELTEENVQKLYKDICLQFGFDSWDWDSRDYIVIEHIYTEPVYLVSYVVSNDVALQIYQAELETPGKGLKLYEQALESSDSYLIYFAESLGLESPFAHGRLEKVKETFQNIL